MVAPVKVSQLVDDLLDKLVPNHESTMRAFGVEVDTFDAKEALLYLRDHLVRYEMMIDQENAAK